MNKLDLCCSNLQQIRSTGTNIEVQPDTPTLDATGMLIMPAGIDMSTYLIQDIHSIDTEAYINFTKEALLGGTTTIGKFYN